MKTRGGKFLMFLGAALAIMAFVVVYVVMSKGLVGATAGQAQSVPTVPPTVSLAVVNKDVPAYTVLDASSLATVDVDASTVSTNTTTSPNELYGKMTLVPLTKGQPVRLDQLTTAGFSDILATGERAFSLAVPARDTFGNAVTDNDHVDVLWSAVIQYKAQSVDATGKPNFVDAYYTTTKTLLQNVHVLRVIQLSQAPPAGKNGQSNNTSASNADANSGADATAGTTANTAPLEAMYTQDAPFQSVLILGVTDQQAEVLAYARDNGEIDLTLRSSAVQKDETGAIKKDAAGHDIRGDAEAEKTSGITLDTLIQQYGLPMPKAYTPQQ